MTSIGTDHLCVPPESQWSYSIFRKRLLCHWVHTETPFSRFPDGCSEPEIKHFGVRISKLEI